MTELLVVVRIVPSGCTHSAGSCAGSVVDLCQLPLMNFIHATLADHMGKVAFQLSIKCFLYCTLRKIKVVGIFVR